jgi:hypothetical protein
MMATTHVLAALAVASVVAVVSPEFGTVAAVAAVLGGIAPDLDLYSGHRKTLHYPIYLPVAAVAAVLLAVVVPTGVTVGLAVFLVSAGLHSAMDAWGGGLELKPWRATSEKAVFSHYHGGWIAPRRLVRYDGAPEDLLLGAVFAIPVLLVFPTSVDWFVGGILAVSAIYVLLRKPMVAFGEWAVQRLPARVIRRIPDPVIGDLVDSSGRDQA